MLSSLLFRWEDTPDHSIPLQGSKLQVKTLQKLDLRMSKTTPDSFSQVVRMVTSESGASLILLKMKSSQPQMETTSVWEFGARTKTQCFNWTTTASYHFSCVSRKTLKLSFGTAKKSLRATKLVHSNHEPPAKASRQLQPADVGYQLIPTFVL